MKYICTNCNYIFDEKFSNSEDTIEKVTNETICPSCEEFDSFQWIEEIVNYAVDNDNLELLEVEHIPQVEKLDKEWKNIKVIAWLREHPMWLENRIISISLFDEYWDLVLEEFLYEDSEPTTEFDVSDFDEYEIRVKCSLHWVWWRKIVK